MKHTHYTPFSAFVSLHPNAHGGFVSNPARDDIIGQFFCGRDTQRRTNCSGVADQHKTVASESAVWQIQIMYKQPGKCFERLKYHGDWETEPHILCHNTREKLSLESLIENTYDKG